MTESRMDELIPIVHEIHVVLKNECAFNLAAKRKRRFLSEVIRNWYSDY